MPRPGGGPALEVLCESSLEPNGAPTGSWNMCTLRGKTYTVLRRAPTWSSGQGGGGCCAQLLGPGAADGWPSPVAIHTPASCGSCS
jgi:hypothetical protein